MGFGDRLSKSAGMSIIVATALGEEVTSISSSGSYPGSSTGSGCGCSFVRQPHNDKLPDSDSDFKIQTITTTTPFTTTTPSTTTNATKNKDISTYNKIALVAVSSSSGSSG